MDIECRLACRTAFFGINLLVGIIVQGSTFAEPPNLKSKFLAESPEAWKKLEAVVDQVEFKASLRDAIMGLKQDRPDVKEDMRFIANRPSKLIEVTREDKGSIVVSKNKNYYFSIMKTSQTSPFQVKYMGKDEKSVDPIFQGYFLRSYNNVFADFIAFRKMLEGSKISIGAVEEVIVDGNQCVRIEFVGKPEAIAPLPWRKGWIILDPNQLWGVRKFEVTADWGKSKGRATGLVEYGEKKAGLPSLRRTEVKQIVEAGEQAGLSQMFETRFTKWEHRVIPENEFKFPSFGLPEIGDPPKQGALNRSGVTWYSLAALFATITTCLYKARNR